MRPKLLFLIDHFGSGGAQRQIINLAIGLKSAGYEVEFAIYYPEHNHFKELVIAAGISVNEFRKKSRYSFAILFPIVKLVRKRHFDVIISYLDAPNVYAELVSKMTGIKCIVSERSTFPDPKHIPFRRKLQCSLHAWADHIIVNSCFHQQALMTAFPKLSKKISMLYNIVDEQFFEVADKRQEYGENDILCVGTVNSNKNPLVVIRAINLLKTKHSLQVKVKWAGKFGALPEDKEYFLQCNELLADFQLQDQWEWVGESRNIKELYSAYMILVHPSFFEGLPNAICEAMASGMVILASNVCEHPKLLAGMVNDLLFPPDNPEQLAEKLLYILHLDGTGRKVIGNSLADRAKQLFDQRIIIRKFINILDNYNKKPLEGELAM